MKESTALSIYNNPYALQIMIYGKGGLFSIGIHHVINTGATHESPKWMFATKLFLKSFEDAVKTMRQVLEQVLKYAHQKSVTANVFDPDLIYMDQDYVLNTDIINRIIEELRRDPSKPIVCTDKMKPR